MFEFEIIVFIVMLIIIVCFMHPIFMEEIPCFYCALLIVSAVSIILKILNIMILNIIVKYFLWFLFICLIIKFILIYFV